MKKENMKTQNSRARWRFVVASAIAVVIVWTVPSIILATRKS
jgi:hypothetical protein